MRLDHIALRVADREKTVELLQKAFGYTVQKVFTIKFNDGTFAECSALSPIEAGNTMKLPWVHAITKFGQARGDGTEIDQEHVYHTPPEIFVSQGSPGSVVDTWVKNRDGIGGIHHLAMQCEDVRSEMLRWKSFGAEFTSDDILTCPDDELHQIFMKPHPLLGFVLEFIRRGEHGFCEANVKDLMVSTKDLK